MGQEHRETIYFQQQFHLNAWCGEGGEGCTCSTSILLKVVQLLITISDNRFFLWPCYVVASVWVWVASRIIKPLSVFRPRLPITNAINMGYKDIGKVGKWLEAGANSVIGNTIRSRSYLYCMSLYLTLCYTTWAGLWWTDNSIYIK